MRSITVNKVVYPAKKIGFNTICEWEEAGISLAEMQKKPMGMIRAYAAMCAGKTIDEMGEEIEQHIINGGDFTSIMEVIGEEMNESGFFRGLSKNAEKEAEKSEKTSK